MPSRAMQERLNHASLYGILDTGYVAESELESVAEALLAGGVSVLQLRAKGYDEASVLNLIAHVAPRLPSMCREYKVPFIINDFPKVAVAVGADGVHIGQDDGSLAEVREIVGNEMIIGRSTHSLQQALAAKEEGFDYIGFGPLFPTPTKKGRPGIGLTNIAAVQQEVGTYLPVFCIGGIKPDNLELVISSGARNVVIVSSLLQAHDIRAATRSIITQLNASFF